MSDTIETLRDGDVYRWSYRDQRDDRYHCCSRIAIVQNGVLRDTYWQVGQSISDGKWFQAGALSALNLNRLGNLADLEKAPEYQADYYDDAYIVDLNHSNSTRGNFYLRKGAVRSQKKMLEVARSYLERSILDERRAAEKTTRFREAISKIEAGDLSCFL